MRKLLFSIAVLGSVAGAAGLASAAPHPVQPASVLAASPAPVQTVQYREWREREHWRHRRHEEFRRREWRRHEMWRQSRGYGAPPPLVYGGPPRPY